MLTRCIAYSHTEHSVPFNSSSGTTNLPGEKQEKAKRHFKFTSLAKEKQIYLYYLNNCRDIENKNIFSHYKTQNEPDLA